MIARPLRVLQLLETLDFGGVERLQVTLARLHDPSRLELHVCTLRAPGDGAIARDLQAAGVSICGLDGIRLRNPYTVPRLAQLMRTRGIDLVHSHLPRPHILAAAAGTATSLPAVATLHNLSSVTEGTSRVNRYLERRALRKAMRLVIAVAPAIARDGQRSLGIDPGRITVLPNGIDLAPFEALAPERVHACRRELLRGRDGPLVVSVGTLAPRKAHEVLVDATPQLVDQFPGVQVAIVGQEGTNAALVRERIHTLGLQSHIACVGARSGIAELLAASDVFALPSLIEGLPLALLESMAAGTPVVATSVGGVASVVTDHVTGRIVAPGDPGAFGRAIVECLRSPEQSRRIAAVARARIHTEHNGQAWTTRLTDLYADVSRAARMPS